MTERNRLGTILISSLNLFVCKLEQDVANVWVVLCTSHFDFGNDCEYVYTDNLKISAYIKHNNYILNLSSLLNCSF